MTRLIICAALLVGFMSIPPAVGTAGSLRGSSLPGRRLAGMAKPLSLKQAWQVAIRGARARWSHQAMMAEIGSVDAEGDTVRSGWNGRRRAWMATVVAPNKPGAQLTERILDGVVVEARPAPFPAKDPPMPRAPRIDSGAAIRAAARARPDVGPDRSRDHGFEFIAHVDLRGRMIIAVMGSYRDHPAQVDVDAGSGRVLGALIYTFPARVLFSATSGRRWHKTNLHGGFVAGIAAVPGSPGAAYAVETGIRAIRLWKTRDSGRSWAVASALPEHAATAAHGLVVERLPGYATVIAVGTNSGLWYAAGGSVSWQRSAGLPSGVAQWLAPGWLHGSRALLVSVFTGPDRGGVYASTNLRTWQKILPEADRLSTSVNGAATVALSQDDPGTAYSNTRAYSAHRIMLPLPALSLAGQLWPGGVELAEASDRIMVSGDGGAHWMTALDQRTAQQPLDQVVVDPRFPAEGIALVAGFNGGMFRSVNGGRTWRKVGEFPATGADEIGPVAFLQPSRVVAVSTGPGLWRPF